MLVTERWRFCTLEATAEISSHSGNFLSGSACLTMQMMMRCHGIGRTRLQAAIAISVANLGNLSQQTAIPKLLTSMAILLMVLVVQWH